MYISLQNLKITEVELERGKWVKENYVEHKQPIEKPKVVYEDQHTNLMDIATEARHAAERNPHNKIIVSFELNAEF
jgi:hypothetical protein